MSKSKARADHTHDVDISTSHDIPVQSGLPAPFTPYTPLAELRKWSNVPSGAPIRSEFWTSLHERVCRLEDFSEAVRLLHEKKDGMCVYGCYSCKVGDMLQRLAAARNLMGGRE